jgi:hypothetical protein
LAQSESSVNITCSRANTTQTIAFGLIDNVQSRATDLTAQANSLTGTITVAINSYSGLQTKREISRGMKIARREAVAASA